MNHTIDFDQLSADLHRAFEEDVAQDTLIRILGMQLDRVANITRFAFGVAGRVKIDDLRKNAARRHTEARYAEIRHPLREAPVGEESSREEHVSWVLSHCPETDERFLRCYYGAAQWGIPTTDAVQAQRRRSLAGSLVQRLRARLGVAS